MHLLWLYLFLHLINDSLVFCTDRADIKRKDPRYLFTSPKIVTAGRHETVCMSLYESSLPARLLVDLKIRDKHHVTSHNLQSENECFNISIPRLKRFVKDAQFANIHLQIQLNGTLYHGHTQDPILIYPDHNVTFIETDKNTYKPKDNVKIRILVLTQELKAPENFIVPVIKLINPTGITVNVWENVPTELGLLQLEYDLAHETTMGDWKIEVDDVIKSFSVLHYVLPRFKVLLNYPKVLYTRLNLTTFSICGKYVFNQNVKGIALIKVSLIKFNNQELTEAKELQNGCATFEFLAEALHLKEQVNSYLFVTATITEHGTNRAETDTGTISITNKAYHLNFVDYNRHFQPGLPYHGTLKATNSLIPLREEVIKICYNIAVDKIWNIKDINQCSNLRFEHEDTIFFTIPPVKNNVLQIQLHATSLNQTIQPQVESVYSNKFNNEVNAYFTLNRWYSPSNSYIQLDRTNKVHSKCKVAQQFVVSYTTAKLKENSTINFHYMIKSRDSILKVRSISHVPRKRQIFYHSELKNIIGTNHTHTKSESFVDRYFLKFKLDPKVIARYQLIVYYNLPNGELIAASIDVQVDKCLQNKVEANWSRQHYHPGDKAIFTIRTSPLSLCAVSTVDKALVFRGYSEPLTVDGVLKPFLNKPLIKHSNRLNCVHPSSKKAFAAALITTESAIWDLKRRRKRYYGISAYDQFDTYEAFNSFGVSVISNMKIITKPCLYNAVLGGFHPGYDVTDIKVQSLRDPKDSYYDIQPENRGSYIRSFFPDTWLWELIPIRTQETKISRNLPHTITTWITNTICVSPTLGIGISPQNEAVVFQPFFLEVLAPSSIKREETLHVEVILFNYMNYSIPVRVTLGESDGLELPQHPEEKSHIHCIYSHDSRTVTFRLEGRKLGKFNINVLAEVESSYPGECGPEIIVNRRDMVSREIVVEPEGYPVNSIKSTLLCTQDSAISNNVSWNLDLPDNIISDSATATLLINGDLMGPALHNLEKLLLVPTGCGEQIMATLAPNLFILEYLKATRRLTPSVQQRAKRNLKIGYQRILDYSHKDGSFSAFGYHDLSGSMFLTTFVVWTLQHSKAHIYVDQNIIDQAVRWILENQLENGCFATISHVFHDMGGTNTENSTAALTSYVLISLLEAGIELSETVRTNAKYCIRGHFSPDKYTLAISNYALTLVGWESEASRSLQRLLQVATHEDNLMWWSTPGSSATNIEMTSYVLKSLLHRNSTENLVYANSIVRWLITQQGPNGGFVTTQDTVMALSAITKYAILMHNSNTNLTVNVNAENENYKFFIHSKDQLKTKQETIRNLPNSINIKVDGSKGCILVQAYTRYNLWHITSSEAFKLAIDIDPVSSTNHCSMATISPCVSYIGPRLLSNMAILEIAMPSGYEPDRASLFKLVEESNSKVKKFEENEKQVVLYFTELGNEPTCVPFYITENSKVDARIDANIKLYDYYNPEVQVSDKYKINNCTYKNILPIPQLPVNENGKNNETISLPSVYNFISTLGYDEVDN